MKDYYEILGIGKDADEFDVKRAYRKLSMKFHPDKNDGDEYFENMFKNIKEAYDVLSDSTKKREYDRAYDQFINFQSYVSEDFNAKNRESSSNSTKRTSDENQKSKDSHTQRETHNDKSEKPNQGNTDSYSKSSKNEYDVLFSIVIGVFVLAFILFGIANRSDETKNTSSSDVSILNDETYTDPAKQSTDIEQVDEIDSQEDGSTDDGEMSNSVPMDMYGFVVIEYLAYNHLEDTTYTEEKTEHKYISITRIKKITNISEDKKRIYMDQAEEEFARLIYLQHDGYEKIMSRDIFVFESYAEASVETEKIRRRPNFKGEILGLYRD